MLKRQRLQSQGGVDGKLNVLLRQLGLVLGDLAGKVFAAILKVGADLAHTGTQSPWRHRVAGGGELVLGVLQVAASGDSFSRHTASPDGVLHIGFETGAAVGDLVLQPSIGQGL